MARPRKAEAGADMPPSNVTNDTIREYVRELMTAQRGIDEATGRKRAILKRAKAAGCNLDGLSTAAAAKRQDPAEVIERERQRVRYLAAVDITVFTTQAELFHDAPISGDTDESKREMDEFHIEDAGYAAGKDGASHTLCPYHVGSEKQALWMRGYHRGQQVIAAKMKVAEEGFGPEDDEEAAEEEAAEEPAPPPPVQRGRGRPRSRGTAH
jgi:ribosome modulation factor